MSNEGRVSMADLIRAVDAFMLKGEDELERWLAEEAERKAKELKRIEDDVKKMAAGEEAEQPHHYHQTEDDTDPEMVATAIWHAAGAWVRDRATNELRKMATAANMVDEVQGMTRVELGLMLQETEDTLLQEVLLDSLTLTLAGP